MIDRTVSSYRILRKLGEGGMGVVYQARDPRLERFVALKFLPHDLLVDDAERARFLQEARSASQLNHPNICVIHDIGEHEGEPFLVMEFVEGETLRRRIAAGPLRLETVLDYALQVGEALHEAHARGIVHRDIKSDNIMVTPQGRIKVLDFGLARLHGAARAVRTTTTSGTVAYMAPEQIREGLADARSDIFSFGVVLYEMLAGRLPFRGERDAAVMYAVLNTAPEPVTHFRPELSSEILHLLDRALEKDPADRYQSVDDMLIDLRRLKRESGRAARPLLTMDEAVAAGGTATGGAGRARSRRRPLLLAAAAVLVLALAGLVWRLLPQGPPRLNPGMTFRTLPVPMAEIGYPGMSPDGRWVVFPAADSRSRWDIWFMNADGGEPRRVSADSSGEINYVDISPDGSQVVYTANPGDGATAELRSVPTLGGTSRFLARGGQVPHWSPDGARIGYILTSDGRQQKARPRIALWTMRPDGSDARQEFVDSLGARGGQQRICFTWSPDGREVAWLRNLPGGYQEIIARELRGGRERVLTHDRRNIDEVYWTRQGGIVFSSNRGGNTNLWMVRASGGPPVQVTKGAGPDVGMRVSADGRRLLYLQQQPVAGLWLASLVTGESRRVAPEEMRLGVPALSPDGSTIAVVIFDPDPLRNVSHLFLMARDGSNRRQVTFGEEVVNMVAWSPDGRLACSAAPADQPADSGRTWLVDPARPGNRREIGPGRLLFWEDSATVCVLRGQRAYAVGLDGREQPAGPDSIAVLGLPGGGQRLFFDLRPLHREIWLGPVAARRPGEPGTRLLLNYVKQQFLLSPDLTQLIVVSETGRASRILLPSGGSRPLGPLPQGMTRQSLAGLGWDGRDLVYTAPRLVSKLVLIENLH